MIVASILLSTCDTNFSLQNSYFTNPNGENVRKWVPKVVSTFHNDPTVDESRIIVLLRQILSICGKREISVRGTFPPPQKFSRKSQRWVCAKISSHTFKFHDDPTVNKFRIIVLLR